MLQGLLDTDVLRWQISLPVFLAFCVSGLVLSIFRAKIAAAQAGPLLGLSNAKAMANYPINFLRQANEKYGELFKVNMLVNTTYWLMDKQLNKAYLDMKEDIWSFSDGMGVFLNKLVKPGYFDHFRTFVGSMASGITKTPMLNYISEVTERETLKSVETWCGQSDVELFESVSYLVHRIMVATLMGPDFFEHHVDELFDLLHEMEANVGSLWNVCMPEWVPHPPARRLWKARDRVTEIFNERLAAREQQPEKWTDAQDYISYTLRDPKTAHLKHYYGAHHTLLMFAAHTSTVALISWMVFELFKSPSRLEALERDLEANSATTSAYMDSLIKETTRFYVSINDLRLVRRAEPIKQRPDLPVIPQGSIVSISPYLTHHDPGTWLLPDTWYPERWQEDPELDKKVNSSGELCYMPFGAGSHRCPGEKMAVRVTSTAVAAIVKIAKIEWGTGGREQNTTRLDFSKVGSPWMKGDVRLRFSKR